MANHFDTIAKIYDDVWYFSENYQTSMLNNIMGLLQLNRDDVLVDIGGGTGSYTHKLRETAGLDSAYCIEPSLNMYLEASKIPTITSICTDEKGFMELDLNFSKVLMKEMVHHIREREVLWRYLRKKLPAYGRILIVTRPQDTALPLFEKARAAFRHNQPDQQTLLKELQSSGFDTDIRLHPYSFMLEKKVWFEMIRNRFMSDLANFTEEEIEAGLREIDAKYPAINIEIPDNILYIAASTSR